MPKFQFAPVTLQRTLMVLGVSQILHTQDTQTYTLD